MHQAFKKAFNKTQSRKVLAKGVFPNRGTQRRMQLANAIREHRETTLSKGYQIGRTPKYLQDIYAFDINKFLAKLMPKRRPLYLLDSGAGDLSMIMKLKATFGKKIHTTALTLVYPNMRKKEIGRLHKNSMAKLKRESKGKHLEAYNTRLSDNVY